MKRNEYLKELKLHLNRLPAVERDEILRDQDEYFSEAVEAGRSEEDVARGLGDPRALAASLLAEGAMTRAETSNSLGKRAREIPRIFGSLLILAPFNFIVVLAPYCAIAALLFALWCMCLGVGIGAMFGLGQFHLASATVGTALSFSRTLAVDFFTFGVAGLAGLGTIAAIYLTRYFVHATIAYLRWNINFVMNSRKEQV